MDDDEVQEILRGIHSRLGQIDGKTSLNVRANRENLIDELEREIGQNPLIGQIYLLVDGKLTQGEVGEALGAFGLKPSAMAVSRAFDAAFGNGLLLRKQPAKGKRGKVWVHDPAMESILRLTKEIPKWLKANDAVVPVGPKRRRKEAAKKTKGAA